MAPARPSKAKKATAGKDVGKKEKKKSTVPGKVPLDATLKPYEAGPDSHRFIDGAAVLPKGRARFRLFHVLLVVLLNDALNDCSADVGFDGWFLMRRPLNEDLEPLWKFGPQACFVRGNRSPAERAQWSGATLGQKVRLSSIPLNHRSLPDNYPVYPIWTIPGRPQASFTQQPPGQRVSPFAPSKYYPRPGQFMRDRTKTTSTPNPTTIRRGNVDVTPGIFIDLYNSEFVCDTAERASLSAVGNRLGRANWDFKYANKVVSGAVKVSPPKALVFDDGVADDPVLQLLAWIIKRIKDEPADAVSFRHMSEWSHRDMTGQKDSGKEGEGDASAHEEEREGHE